MLNTAGAQLPVVDRRDVRARRQIQVDIERREGHRQAERAKATIVTFDLAEIAGLQAGFLVRIQLAKAKLATTSGEGLRELIVRSYADGDRHLGNSTKRSDKSLRNVVAAFRSH
jgi:hypothetical protein